MLKNYKYIRNTLCQTYQRTKKKHKQFEWFFLFFSFFSLDSLFKFNSFSFFIYRFATVFRCRDTVFEFMLKTYNYFNKCLFMYVLIVVICTKLLLHNLTDCVKYINDLKYVVNMKINIEQKAHSFIKFIYKRKLTWHRAASIFNRRKQRDRCYAFNL